MDRAPATALRPDGGPAFEERLTGPFAPEAYVIALPLVLFGGVGWAAGLPWLGGALLVLGLFCALFFRNPGREIPGDACDVVAPADGRVVAAGEVELADGRKALRVGIFLSIFDVHVNRAPVEGRVVKVERGGERYLAAFDPRAEQRNVRLAMELETAGGERVTVVQITGLIARRIVCQPRVGQTLARGVRYGLIRFGSRTDVWLPAASELRVQPGERVRGGASVVARLRPPAAREPGR